jgi:transposase-like protein
MDILIIKRSSSHKQGLISNKHRRNNSFECLGPSDDVRRVAQRVKNAAQARRLLAIAAVLDGSSREQAAKIGGMDRQTLRDWVIPFNEQGPNGLINILSSATPTSTAKATAVKKVNASSVALPKTARICSPSSAPRHCSMPTTSINT